MDSVASQAVQPASGANTESVVFVDAGIADYQTFVRGVLPGHRVVVIDPQHDELGQITAELSAVAAAGQKLKQVHLVSHGSPGALRLGKTRITTEVLQSRAEELRNWRRSLDPAAEILLYGCETGAGESGRRFLKQWADLTGASVAASTNLTGAAKRGGDWKLEASVGSIGSLPAFDSVLLDGYPAVLADYIFYHDGTAGKLYRSELDGANQTAILTYNGSFSTVAVDFVVADPVNSNVYYNRVFNDVNRGLYKTTFAGASPVRISPNTTNLISGMSLDLVNNKIYIHDDTAGKWYRMNLDGSGAQVLQTTAGTATFSAVDTKHSVFYYTQTIVGSTRGLYKTDLAMTTAGTQITTAGNQITGVAVDMAHDKIYYHDNTGTAIFQANLDGSSPVNKLTTSANTPVIGITVDQVNQRIYYAGTAGSSFQSLRGVYRTADLDLTTPTRVSTANDLVGPAGVTTIYVAAPSISGVTGPSAGSYNAGDNLDFTVTYDTAVDITGSPYLPLTVGSSSVNATYSSGTGTTSLVFRYTVQAGDTDSNGIASSSPLVLNGGTILKASSSTAATLTFTPPATTSVLVDTTAPTISIGSPSASITAGGPVSYTVTYSDANFQSSTLSAGNVTVNTTGSASPGSVSVTGSGTTRTVTLGSITGNGTLSISIDAGTATDVAGNAAAAAGPSTSFTVDNAAPGVSIGTPSASLTAGGPVSFTVTYSDANFNHSTLSAGNITVNTTGSASLGSVSVTGSGTTRTVTLGSLTGNGTLSISLPAGTATDLAGNSAAAAGPSASFSVDNAAPNVSIGSPSVSATAGGPVSFAITYSDLNFSSATLNAGDITVNSTGTASAGSVSVTGSGTTRTVTLSSLTGDGTLGISLSSGTASDTIGNLAGAAGPSTAFTVDNTAPGVVISSPSVPAATTGPVTYTIFYSGESGITLGSGDITLNKTGSADAGSIGVSGTGGTRTVTLSSLSGVGTLGISIAAGTATDAAGNLAAAAGPGTSFTVDNSPVVTTVMANSLMLISANVNGLVNPNGLSTVAVFESGTDTNYGTVSAITLTPDGGTTVQAVNLDLSGLTPGTTYHYRVAATNSAGASFGEDLTFTTAADTSAPTDIGLSPATVPENQSVGITVGTLTAPDPDAALGDTASYELVTGTGDTDNASFAIVDNQLQTAAVFDYETKNSYSIRVRVTDIGGLTLEKALTIAIGDINEPPAYSGYGLNCPVNTAVSLLVSKIIAKTSDPEGTARTVTATDCVSLQGGTVALLSGPPKTISYMPPTGFSGSDSFGVTISDGVNLINGIVTVTVGSSSGNGNALVSITAVGSDVVLKFAGIPGTHYEIQRSGSLTPPVTWSTLTTVTANASGFATHTDPTPPSPSYWRTVTVP